jgi:hypothetical protein
MVWLPLKLLLVFCLCDTKNIEQYNLRVKTNIILIRGRLPVFTIGTRILMLKFDKIHNRDLGKALVGLVCGVVLVEGGPVVDGILVEPLAHGNRFGLGFCE